MLAVDRMAAAMINLDSPPARRFKTGSALWVVGLALRIVTPHWQDALLVELDRSLANLLSKDVSRASREAANQPRFAKPKLKIYSLI
jgi:hypothetical protein